MLFATSSLLQTRFDININHTLQRGGWGGAETAISIFTKRYKISFDMRLGILMSVLSIANDITFS